MEPVVNQLRMVTIVSRVLQGGRETIVTKVNWFDAKHSGRFSLVVSSYLL